MNFKNVIIWSLIVLLAVGLMNIFQSPERANVPQSKVAFSKFLSVNSFISPLNKEENN